MDTSTWLGGNYAALLTPFDKRGAVNEAALRLLVSRSVDQGIDGFYVCGSTGEAFLLTMEERKRIIRIVTDEVRSRVRIICHIGAIGTGMTIDLGRDAFECGVDAVSSIPPFYYKFSREEYLQYYIDLAEAVDLPLIPYNFPALSGVSLTGEMVQELREHKNIVGIKFTSSDLFQMEQMRSLDPGLLIYNGFDEIYLAGLSMGASGAIGSTLNFMPQLFHRIRTAFEAGEMDQAYRLQARVNRIVQALLQTGKLLNGHKYILLKQGIDFGECRRPFLPLTDDDRRNLDAVFDQI